MESGRKDRRRELELEKRKAKRSVRRRRRFLICLIIGVPLALVICGLTVWLTAFNPFDSNASQGRGSTLEQTRQQLQEEADKSQFRVKVNAEPHFETGDAEGSLFLENPSANVYNMQAVVTLDETGEILYESDVLLPGGQRLKVKLNRALPDGEYPATVTATAIDRTTQQPVGEVKTAIVIKVGTRFIS